MRSNFLTLLAAKEQRAGGRISLRRVATDTGLNEYTVRGFAKGTLREIPTDALVKLCEYLGCEIGELLVLEEIATV